MKQQRTRTSELSTRISVQLALDIASGKIASGIHLSAQQVADQFGTSRTPVREALSTLESNGMLERRANRGYFTPDVVPESAKHWLDSQMNQATEPYAMLANDWLLNNLPEEVTEQHLRTVYGWTKSKINEVLVRAAREGWAERKEGYGWRLLPVAKTVEAFEQIYRFRLSIEPAAILEPSFILDRNILGEQRRLQEHMLEIDLGAIRDETLLANGSAFHEEIIKLSRNPFFYNALKQVNRMRRLMEYNVQVDHERVIDQCTQHLQIIDLLELGDVVAASYEMRQHLSGALKRKSPIARIWVEQHEND